MIKPLEFIESKRSNQQYNPNNSSIAAWLQEYADMVIDECWKKSHVQITDRIEEEIMVIESMQNKWAHVNQDSIMKVKQLIR